MRPDLHTRLVVGHQPLVVGLQQLGITIFQGWGVVIGEVSGVFHHLAAVQPERALATLDCEARTQRKLRGAARALLCASAYDTLPAEGDSESTGGRQGP